MDMAEDNPETNAETSPETSSETSPETESGTSPEADAGAEAGADTGPEPQESEAEPQKPVRKPRRKRPGGRWSNPASPLQAARFERRKTGKEVVAGVRALCPGHAGDTCRLDLSKLSDFENNRRSPGLPHIQALARYYQKSPEELGLIAWRAERSQFVTAGGSAMPQPEFASAADPAFARDPLRGTLAAVLQLGEPDQPTRPARTAVFADPLASLAHEDQQRLATTTVSDTQLARLEQAVDEHVRGYYELTAPARLRTLVTDWATARGLLDRSQTPSQRARLTRDYARLTGILAALAFDHDYPQRARVLLDTAHDAAREAGDTDLTNWILEQRGMIAEWDHDPRQTVAFTTRALETQRNSTTPTTAKLHGRAAAAHATLGNERVATRHLEAAERIVTNPPTEGCWPLDKYLPRAFTFTPDTVACNSGKAFLRLGDHARAVEHCQRAATLQHDHGLSTTTALAVALNNVHWATALVHTGDLDQAHNLALRTLRSYRGVGTALLIRRARDLAADMTATDPTSPRTQELQSLLTDPTSHPPQPGSA